VWDYFASEPPTIGLLKIEVFLIIHAGRIGLLHPACRFVTVDDNVLVAPLLRS